MSRLDKWLEEKFRQGTEEGVFAATAIRKDWMEELLKEQDQLRDLALRLRNCLMVANHGDPSPYEEQLIKEFDQVLKKGNCHGF